MGSGRFTKEERSQPKVERKPGGNARKESRQEMSSGRFTNKEGSQPKVKRQPEGNLNRGSCHSFHTADTWEQEPKHVFDLLKEQDQIGFHANERQQPPWPRSMVVTIHLH
uniref:Uncharacterized protein n=1 Tax=Fagus sylvatica TaxID=28930 RepID=A0A2N9FUV2_FAGSY